MGARSSGPEAALEAVEARIACWRRTRAYSRAPMPEELWGAAVALCKHFTVHSVSQHLRLGYDRLRRRCVEAQGPSPVVPSVVVRGDPPIQFVELGRQEGPAGRPEPASTDEVEFVRPDGARMIVRSRQPLDLRDLTCAFLEGRP